MIKDFARIERHRGEISRIEGKTVRLSDGQSTEADLILWGTGYAVDLSYFEQESLSRITGLEELARRCGSLFLSLDAPNLFFLAQGVLETTTSTPWAYAHVAKSIVSHIRGNAVFDRDSRARTHQPLSTWPSSSPGGIGPATGRDSGTSSTSPPRSGTPGKDRSPCRNPWCMRRSRSAWHLIGS